MGKGSGHDRDQRRPSHAFGHRVEPGARVSLADIPTNERGPFTDKNDPAVEEQMAADLSTLGRLQEKLFAEGQRAVLVIIQAMDTAGKDGVLRHVVGPLDSRGVDVQGFGPPSTEERAHDYLWRVHAKVPRAGHMTFFNRSHYEDVLAARVEKLVPKEVWKKRYRHINEFERMLVDSGTTVRKFFLHISKEEQKRRLEARLADPKKRWKFDPSDLEARSKWDDYHAAYEDALAECSTDHAPWDIIPADHRWYRNLCVARALCETLEQLDPRYPEHDIDYSKVVIPD